MMGIFNFYNKDTGEHFTDTMTIKEAEAYVKKNKHIEWLCSAPKVVDPTKLMGKKPDDGFRDRLKDIKKSHRGSKINTF
jgi:hypothetical protein